MKRLTGTNKEIAELLYQEQLELQKKIETLKARFKPLLKTLKNVETRPFVTIQLNLIRLT